MRLLREAMIAGWKHPASSIVSVLLASALCVSVLLTSGRAAAAKDQALSRVDALGTRSIIIRADARAAITSDVIGRVQKVREVAWVGGFTAPTDVRNAQLADSTPVASRTFYVGRHDHFLPPNPAGSAQALKRLQMPDGGGTVRSASGEMIDLPRPATTPAFLDFLEPVVLVPPSTSSPAGLAVIVILAKQAQQVDTVTRAVVPLLGAPNPTDVHIETSSVLAQLRSDLASQLGAFGKNLVLLMFSTALVLTAAVLLALMVMQRKDFGRRRALGATRSQVIALVTLQALLTSALGAFAASFACWIWFAVVRDPIPPWAFVLATAILAVAASVLGSVGPAVYASTRDPAHELRVP